MKLVYDGITLQLQGLVWGYNSCAIDSVVEALYWSLVWLGGDVLGSLKHSKSIMGRILHCRHVGDNSACDDEKMAVQLMVRGTYDVYSAYSEKDIKVLREGLGYIAPDSIRRHWYSLAKGDGKLMKMFQKNTTIRSIESHGPASAESIKRGDLQSRFQKSVMITATGTNSNPYDKMSITEKRNFKLDEIPDVVTIAFESEPVVVEDTLRLFTKHHHIQYQLVASTHCLNGNHFVTCAVDPCNPDRHIYYDGMMCGGVGEVREGKLHELLMLSIRDDRNCISYYAKLSDTVTLDEETHQSPAIPKAPYRFIGKGIRNHQNTCYINSMIQCICHIPGFPDFILTKTLDAARDAMVFQLQHHIGLSFDPLGDIVLDSPTQLIETLTHINYSGSILCHTGEQEDVAEFLVFYIDYICNALGCWSFFTSGYVSDVRTCLRDGCDARNEPNSLERVSLSEQAVITLCILNRSNVREALDAHLSMSVNVFCDCSVPGCSNQRLQQCKDSNPPNTCNEILTCDDCQKEGRVLVGYEKTSPFVNNNGDTVILQLKRFYCHGGESRKHEINVTLHDSLKIHIGNGAYELFAFIVHVGETVHCGHYYAYVKTEQGNWFCMDDENVTPVTHEVLYKEEPYILFYTKIAQPHQPSAYTK